MPRALYPDKPLDLGEIFYLQANTNVAFAFNPIAEGILNFGKYAAFIVPIVIGGYILIGKKLLKHNVLFYAIFFGYSADIFRGDFSNCAFDLLFLIILVGAMSHFSIIGDKEKENEVFNCNLYTGQTKYSRKMC